MPRLKLSPKALTRLCLPRRKLVTEYPKGLPDSHISEEKMSDKITNRQQLGFARQQNKAMPMLKSTLGDSIFWA